MMPYLWLIFPVYIEVALEALQGQTQTLLPRWVDASTISFRPWPYFPKPSPSLKPILAWRKEGKTPFLMC